MDSVAILMLSTGWGGLEMNTLKLALLLKERNWNVTLIISEASRMEQESTDLFDSIKVLRNRKKHFDFKNASVIASFLKKNNICTILVSNNKDLEIVSFVKQLFYRKLRVVYQQHMQIGIDKKDLIHTLRFKAINEWISPLQWLKNEVIARTHFPENHIHVIPIGLDIQRFIQASYSKEEALAILQITPKAPLVGIIGRITEKKGQGLLIQALLDLRARGIEIEVLIFGSATVNDASSQVYEREIKQLVQKHHLQEVVHFREASKDVALFYKSVDVFTLASESETYGMVTIEAMLSCIPVIGTNAGGTPELLQNGTLGFLFEYYNVAGYCKMLESVLNNRAYTQQVVEKAYAHAVLSYSQEAEVTQVIKLLK